MNEEFMKAIDQIQDLISLFTHEIYKRDAHGDYKMSKGSRIPNHKVMYTLTEDNLRDEYDNDLPDKGLFFISIHMNGKNQD